MTAIPDIDPLIVGNWKMNMTRRTAEAWIDAVLDGLAGPGPRCVVCPPAPLLWPVADRLRTHAPGGRLDLGAQDSHRAATGAHTGDTGLGHLGDVGCRRVILGHSERRAGGGETDDIVRTKADAVLAAGMAPILCVGEDLAARDTGRAETVVAAQLRASLPAAAAAGDIVLAYEPVWAIGTGRTPTTDDIAAMHRRLRAALSDQLGPAGGRVPILYGGSVTPDNAGEILRTPEVGGVLVGGASLSADGFLAIAAAAPGPA